MSVQLTTEKLVTIFLPSLTAIKGAVTALMDSSTGDDRETRSALLAETLTAADRLDAVVENLLCMSRRESGMLKVKKSLNDVVDLVSVVADALHWQSRDHPLTITIDEAVSVVFLDFTLIMQVLGNILLNMEHTPPGTPVNVSVEREGNALLLTVSDEGPGVLPEELPDLFGKFFRGKNAVPPRGVGLGLSVCKAIVEAHGGNIAAHINRKGGLSIPIFLPDAVPFARDGAAS
jgi:two-component system, OmpR family, sensor histidine kinase KdpD